MIPYGKQKIDQQDIDAVIDVLKSNWLTQGPKVPAFEQVVASYTGADYAVAVNSATSALHIACLALDIAPGDRVWTSPITFVASANCALYCGAEVDFVDVSPDTGNMCPDALAAKLVAAKQSGQLPKVVIPVHLCGHSCDMQAIHALAEEYGFKVIEDASHGIGGSYQGYKLGNCQYSDITVFSFHPVKIITSAEGGIATTNCPELAKKMGLYRSHGVTREQDRMLRPNEGDWYYEQHELGFNYRMTDVHAALGLSQMNKLDKFVLRRNELAQRYDTLLSPLALEIVKPLPMSRSAWHLQIVRLHDSSMRRRLFDSMREADIQVHVHYFPVHLQPFYLGKKFAKGMYPAAESFYNQILTLPLHTELSEDEQDIVVKELSSQLNLEGLRTGSNG